MSYADKEKLKAASRRYYLKHRDRIIARVIDYEKKVREIDGAAYRARKNEAARKRMRALGTEGRAGYLREYRYGVTPEQYAQMLADCDGRCAICGRTGRLHIDHDHETNQVRGLLCGSCNRMIGLAHEDPARLANAIAYLAETKCKEIA